MPVIAILETQLIELDRIGAAKAAAKLDAAIQQLRSDLVNPVERRNQGERGTVAKSGSIKIFPAIVGE